MINFTYFSKMLNPMTHFFRCCLNQLFVVRMVLLLLAIAAHSRLHAQCNPDVTPPTVICVESTTVALDIFSGTATLNAQVFDDGSSDDCCLDTLLVRRLEDGPCDGDNAADPFSGSVTFCCADIGQVVTVMLRAVDCAGNYNECLTLVEVEDKTPPVAVGDELTVVSLGTDGTATVQATTFDDGSYDACCLDTFLVRRLADGPCDADNAADPFTGSVTFCCADLGQEIPVLMRVVDCSGNFNEVLIIVTVADKIKPVCVAPSNLTVSCVDFDPSLVAYPIATATDNCCIDTITYTVNNSEYNETCLNGALVRTFTAVDCNGNASTCSQRITVTYEQNYYVHFPNDVITADVYLPGESYGEPTYFGEDCELLEHSYSDEVIGLGTDSLLKVERSWSIINWCTYDPALPYITVPNPRPNAIENHPSNLVGPIVSDIPGTGGGPWQSTIVKITPSDSTATDYSTFHQAGANAYFYKQILKFEVPLARVAGSVFRDNSANCTLDNGELGLPNWKVKIKGLATGIDYEAITNANGQYSALVWAKDTDVEGSLAASFNYGQSCASAFNLKTNANQTVVRDIPVRLKQDCNLLSVDLSAPFLRRCLPNTYTVKSFNLGAAKVSDVKVAVKLDPYMAYTGSSISGVPSADNTYTFNLGDLLPGEDKTFKIEFNISCDAPKGYTHRSSASVTPYTVCNPSPNWSGADLDIKGVCDGDSVRFVVKNVGTGDMSTAQEFVVVEDVIMYRTLPLQLKSGASQTFVMAANGATWRAAVPEDANHPWGGSASYAVEGCGGIRQTGLVTLFPNNTPNPFETTDCQQNIEVLDPNDKQAFPVGYGPAKLIDANTDIEYMVRFQNQGNLIASSVVVMDTLPEWLDISAARPGTSSHPYDFSIIDGKVLRFRFDNIQLPNSSIDEAGSYGWVKYRVSQQPNNPVGTRIKTYAGIQFDDKAPVMTNTTLHTVGDHFIVTSNHDFQSVYGTLKAAPNPAAESVLFELPLSVVDARFELTNAYGQKVRTAQVNGKQYRFDRDGLASGIYYYHLTLAGATAWSGKVILVDESK